MNSNEKRTAKPKRDEPDSRQDFCQDTQGAASIPTGAPTASASSWGSRELATLNLLAAEVNQSLQLAQVVDIALTKVIELIDVDAAVISLLDEESKELHFAEHRGLPPNVVTSYEEKRLRSGEGLSGLVVSTGVPITVSDIDDDERLSRTDLIDAGFHSFAAIPLRFGNTTIGALSVIAKTQRHFATQDIEFLMTVGQHVGTAIEKARLYEQLIKRNRELTSRQELLSSIVNNAYDGIMLLDQDHKILVFSPGCERITGWQSADVVGKPCFETFECRHSEDPIEQLKVCPLNGLLSGEQDGFYMDMTILRKDGGKSWIGASTSRIHASNGNGPLIVMIWRDITALKEIDLTKSSIISTVSHELRTPLTSIRALSELLVEQDFPPSQTKEMANSINRESVRLAKLVDNVLNVARVESRRVGTDIQQVNVSEMIKESVEALDGQTHSHHFELDLPANGVSAKADPEGVSIIVDNLVSNALKYSESGSTIHISVRATEDAVELKVRDEGIGIPSSEFERVFEKFSRLNPKLAQRSNGVGLGLYTAKSLAETMGGRIQIESEVSKGSTFVVTLPLWR